MIAYRNISQLFCIGILISFFSYGENEPYDYWTWGNSYATENRSVIDTGFNLGCALLGDIIEFTPNSITFSYGYRIDELPHEAKHYDDEEYIFSA